MCEKTQATGNPPIAIFIDRSPQSGAIIPPTCIHFIIYCANTHSLLTTPSLQSCKKQDTKPKNPSHHITTPDMIPCHQEISKPSRQRNPSQSNKPHTSLVPLTSSRIVTLSPHRVACIFNWSFVAKGSCLHKKGGGCAARTAFCRTKMRCTLIS